MKITVSQASTLVPGVLTDIHRHQRHPVVTENVDHLDSHGIAAGTVVRWYSPSYHQLRPDTILNLDR